MDDKETELVEELFFLVASKDYTLILIGYRPDTDNQLRKARCQEIRAKLANDDVYHAVVKCAELARSVFNYAAKQVLWQ